MLLTLVAATPFEIAPTLAYLKKEFETKTESIFTKGKMEIHVLITGVGMVATTYALTKYLAHQPSNLLINLGIGGAYKRTINIGDVFNVVSDRFADLGAEDADGSFLDLQDLGLQKNDDPPFVNGQLFNNDSAAFSFLPLANGLTVNKVHGTTDSITAIQKKYAADIETMEGAAFYYTCLLEKKSFLQIRSVSNYVESRNKENWNVALAIEKLNEVSINILNDFSYI